MSTVASSLPSTAYQMVDILLTLLALLVIKLMCFVYSAIAQVPHYSSLFCSEQRYWWLWTLQRWRWHKKGTHVSKVLETLCIN